MINQGGNKQNDINNTIYCTARKDNQLYIDIKTIDIYNNRW